MLTEQELISGQVNASDDNDGMGELIRNLWNEVAKKRNKVIRLFAEGKVQEAQDQSEIADNMAKELDKYIKNFTNYQKFLNVINKGKGGKILSMSSHASKKSEPSSNGSIVQTVPKQ